jgi:hypothetical protein
MGLGGLLKRLFGGGGGDGGGAGPIGEAAEYKGYQIQPLGERQGGQWLTAGMITKTIGGEVKEHRFIRVDSHSDAESAASFAVIKARQIIDEQGDAIFRERKPPPN